MRYRKVVKTNGTETSRYDYVYSDGRLVVITYTANGTSKTARFIYDSYGEVRGFILDNSATYLYLKNAQGDITAIVDENSAVILTCTYDAWGFVTFGATSMESMALAAELSKINPFTYRGYCYDYDIEMYYLQSRYYDPEICRFINADSTDYLGATGTLLSYNLFAYCENDPVNEIDVTGCYSFVVNKYLYCYYLDNTTCFFNVSLMQYNKSTRKNITLSMFALFENNKIKISTSVPGLRNIINRKWLYHFSEGLFDLAKIVNRSSLSGRTVDGIQFEILIHYIIYIGLKERKNKTKQEQNDFNRVSLIDIGAKNKVNGIYIGYDSNAGTFEKHKKYYSVFESRLFSNKYTAYALYKLAFSLGLTKK